MRVQNGRYPIDEREKKRYARILRLRRERRKKCLMLAIALFTAFSLILICSLSYGAINTHANDGFKYYTSITVNAGESLWEIAGEYMDSHYNSKANYIAEVCRINHLANENAIYAGQTLIVPYYSVEYVR